MSSLGFISFSQFCSGKATPPPKPLTWCWGASLSVLKTCATFPRALRCILKLGMAQRAARLITLRTHTRTHRQREAKEKQPPLPRRHPIPEAARVERLSALQTGGQVLKVVGELLVLAKLHHVVEVLHVLDHRVELTKVKKERVTGNIHTHCVHSQVRVPPCALCDT